MNIQAYQQYAKERRFIGGVMGRMDELCIEFIVVTVLALLVGKLAPGSVLIVASVYAVHAVWVLGSLAVLIRMLFTMDNWLSEHSI